MCKVSCIISLYPQGSCTLSCGSHFFFSHCYLSYLLAQASVFFPKTFHLHCRQFFIQRHMPYCYYYSIYCQTSHSLLCMCAPLVSENNQRITQSHSLKDACILLYIQFSSFSPLCCRESSTISILNWPKLLYELQCRVLHCISGSLFFTSTV